MSQPPSPPPLISDAKDQTFYTIFFDNAQYTGKKLTADWQPTCRGLPRVTKTEINEKRQKQQKRKQHKQTNLHLSIF